jgi:hypothetical protein
VKLGMPMDIEDIRRFMRVDPIGLPAIEEERQAHG